MMNAGLAVEGALWVPTARCPLRSDAGEASPVELLDLDSRTHRVLPGDAVGVEAHVLSRGASMLAELDPQHTTILRGRGVSEALRNTNEG